MDIEAARRAEVEKYIYLYEKPREKPTGKFVKYGNVPSWRLVLLDRYYRKIERNGSEKVLDVGCGWGESRSIAAAAGLAWRGCEVVPLLCDREDRYVDLVVGAHDLPYGRDDFDAISCVDVMEHVREDDVPLVFGEIYRVAPEALIGISLRESVRKCGVLHITVKPEKWWLRHLCWTWQKVEKYPYTGNPKPDEYLVVRVQRYA